MTAYRETKEEVLRELESNRETGLSEKQASERLEKYGLNKLKEKKKKDKSPTVF